VAEIVTIHVTATPEPAKNFAQSVNRSPVSVRLNRFAPVRGETEHEIGDAEATETVGANFRAGFSTKYLDRPGVWPG
jgi:hypothetical protein